VRNLPSSYATYSAENQTYHHLIASPTLYDSATTPPNWDITTTQVKSALHHSEVAKSSTSFGWGKGGKVTSAGWQVTL